MDIDYGNRYIQSYILNLSFPKSLEELKEDYIDEKGQYDIEMLLEDEIYTSWTAPNWAKIGDIIFFMHAKYAHSTITALQTELKERKDEYDDQTYQEINDWLIRGRSIHKRLGGKIFAIARIIDSPEYLQEDKAYSHWRSRVFAGVDEVWILDKPIDLSEFRDFIFVSRQSSITPVYGTDFDKLKEIVIQSNPGAPEYLNLAISAPVPLSKLDKHNWLEISYYYRRCFILEQQFRAFYVDYFLKALGDKKTIYSECRCHKRGISDSFVDNIILFHGKYLMVEVKLNVYNEKDLPGQVSKYCNDDIVYTSSKMEKTIEIEMIHKGYVLVIDTEEVYLYKDADRDIIPLLSLDDVKRQGDIVQFRNRLMMIL